MKIKDVSAAKFDAMVHKSVQLKNCPKCHFFGGEIIVDMPLYGKTEGARARCKQCGYETRVYSMHESIRDTEGRIASPRTQKGILRGILAALNEYNNGGKIK